MDKSFYAIFKTFFKVGTLLLGGGYVILPLLQSELAEKKQWISNDELSQFYAISTSLPGIIAVNTSIFTGRKIAGRKGAIASVLGVITPSFLAIVFLASFLLKISGFYLVKSVFWGIGIGVISLLFFAIKEMWGKCVNDSFSTGIFIFCLILSLIFHFSPVVIVILAVIFGILYQKYNRSFIK